jgi:hypothetical protein
MDLFLRSEERSLEQAKQFFMGKNQRESRS